ncbi:MAG: putative transposase [Gammaproteobacteria bacterium]
MTRHDDARRLLRAIYDTEIDLLPNAHDKTLTLRLHPLANQSADEAVHHLCTELNTTETLLPGTDLRLIYESVSSQNR